MDTCGCVLEAYRTTKYMAWRALGGGAAKAENRRKYFGTYISTCRWYSIKMDSAELTTSSAWFNLPATPVTNTTFEEHHLPTALTAVFITLEALAIAAILFSNALILLVIYRTKTLQTSRNYYVISLVLANIMAAVVAAPALILAQFTLDSSGALCKTYEYFIHLADSAEVFTLCCISYDRYRTIVGSQDTHLSRRFILVTIFVVWLLSALYASESAVLFTHETLYVRENGVTKTASTEKCALDHNRHGLVIEVLLIVSVTLLFIVPLALLTVLYGLIYFNLGHSGIGDKAIKRRKKVFKMMLVLVGTFFFCNLPLEALVLYINLGPWLLAPRTFNTAARLWNSGVSELCAQCRSVCLSNRKFQIPLTKIVLPKTLPQRRAEHLTVRFAYSTCWRSEQGRRYPRAKADRSYRVFTATGFPPLVRAIGKVQTRQGTRSANW